MNPIVKKLPKLNKYIEYISSVENNEFPIVLSGLSDSQKVHFAYSTACYAKKSLCIIASSDILARQYIKDLKALQMEKVMYLPKREVSIYDYDTGSKENTMTRAVTLAKIAQNKIDILVTTIENITQPVIDKDDFLNSVISIKNGQEIHLEDVSNQLLKMGYERSTMVEAKGQFSIRGGIIDIFPSNTNEAVRIELFGEDVDSIRTFDVFSQRSIEMIKSIEIYPATEYIFEQSKIDEIAGALEQSIENGKFSKLAKKEQEKIEQDIEEMRNGNYQNKIDKYFSLFFSKNNILQYIHKNMLVFIDEPERVEQRVSTITYEMQELQKELVDKQRFVPQFMNNIYDSVSIGNELSKKKIIYLQRLEKNLVNLNMPAKRKEYSFSCREVNFFRDSMDIFIKEIQNYYEKGNSILILLQNKTKAINISELLKDNDVPNKYYESMDFIDELEDNKVYITIGYSGNGYEYRDLKLLVLSDNEDEGNQKKKVRKTTAFKQSQKIVLADLVPNDYIVHVTHGIGQFMGIDTLDVNKIKKDYIKIKYKDNDMLYIPTDQMDSIRKYIALNDGAPKITRLGSKEWEKAKAKAKQSAENIAKELVELYAQRQKLKGIAFLPDNDWQNQFEQDFPYQETDDQLRCIKEIKQDMESTVPMDRLLCGDVGYGKTEVAIRAAFKAVMSGKQVAYLVPTTVLAMQQYESFKQRMEEYEIHVEVLSRFRSKKEQKQIIDKLKLGQIDIIIGTHRLFQKDVNFKQLGLLIIDEEHRFGVKHKETIKELKKNIDVLSMTATPIPRTLHMSIVGIRDMSVIYDPPHNRKPVQTYVLEYDKYVIQDAMIRELERNGQVFYLYNKVEDIEKKAVEVQKLVPSAKVEYAHGQMSADELENIMYDFINGKIDILVCTTILESGIDIPNANTIIIENADRMGLAQLYQIRGRVGRKDRQAYAYITYKKNKLLSEDAEKRLKAIKEFTEFGSGFKIALRDLEIRGAGNILGSEQHGHMEAIGYEMYCKMLEDAVRELKGEVVYDEKEVQIDVNITAYIPNSYIPEQNQKIEIYQDIALCQNDEDIQEVIDELVDRFGEIPTEVNNLIEIAKVKNIARKLDILSIVNKKNEIRFEIGDSNTIDNEKFLKMLDKYRLEISVQNNIIVKRLKKDEQNRILQVITDFLNTLG